MEFQEVLEEHERMIHHFIHRYQIRDAEGEFYQEGLIAVWHAYQQHDPSKSKLSTFIYSSISRRFLNMIQKNNRDQEKQQDWLEQVREDDLWKEDSYPLDSYLMDTFKQVLSEKQWCWLVEFVIEDQSVKSIAERHDTTEVAVKNWGRMAKQKIRKVMEQ
ncbi:sigma-70 family RNA polymerase sigma factor [Gracilibacillus caseinilyticus]|uniref:Sigma-70 family RNA polymerase sigma factor n=1 Tax=Gracilibacillus caseinilyticus TaxID=2932256 RepID=A0ABY4F0Z8_9BACI|nr:sigma-70 family RNA polymerase sigma factor [Gracilibacillus caseinilyticus]UOQ50350.1 sigma-70 family RNA polymerase sigma factor [Gracilibacillus caseinilyticus]